jgi:hypothetical protein
LNNNLYENWILRNEPKVYLALLCRAELLCVTTSLLDFVSALYFSENKNASTKIG